uniref:glycoprotein-N-acetylgalactosamine 3-beta-galactosyltransferase 1-like n=1 Tax=Styela clava TaxID=7725 RepID=UPI00193A49BA|nr:glycoprotein-N-acetylgalactosamine 3-beta-galactosyltransferase 1-like [Styela clava]
MAVFKYISLAFMCGLVFGTGFTLMLFYYQSMTMHSVWGVGVAHEIARKDYEDPDSGNKIVVGRKDDYLEESSETRTVPPKIMAPVYVDAEDNTTAEQLYQKVRVLCWIMTSPATLEKKASHVRDTWSKRCNIRLFMSSVEDKNFPAVGLPVKEGRDQLYEKTKEAYKYAWEHYKDQADWFMKADDDTYLVVENLRFLLKDYDPKKPLFFGRKFKPFINQGYMSGGAGYVLSNDAVRRFVEGIETKKCPKGGGVEDVEMGRCMEKIGVIAGDSRDADHRETFHPLGPIHHLKPGSIPPDNWFWKYNYYPTCLGPECSSNYPITFHYVSTDEMHIFDFMIYNVKIYGLSYMYSRYPKLPYET